MAKIDLENIDLRKLHQINSKQHLESNLFHNQEHIYKIFKDLSIYQTMKKQRKIELLKDGENLENVIMPKDELFYQNEFIGYTMEYIKNSIPLFDFNKRSKDISLFLKILLIVSKSLEKIHQDPRNILVGDLNFDNIIIDKDFNPYFVDFDSCKIKGLENEAIPAILGSYLLNRNIIKVDTTKNTDKFSLLLCTLYMIFKKHIDVVSIYQYDQKSEKIETLKNIREFILEMKKNEKVPEVPYLHEIISPIDIHSKKTITHIKSRKRIQL